MNVNHVHLSSGRLISDNSSLSKIQNRGINTHGKLAKYFVDRFGSGTI